MALALAGAILVEKSNMAYSNAQGWLIWGAFALLFAAGAAFALWPRG